MSAAGELRVEWEWSEIMYIKKGGREKEREVGRGGLGWLD